MDPLHSNTLIKEFQKYSYVDLASLRASLRFWASTCFPCSIPLRMRLDTLSDCAMPGADDARRFLHHIKNPYYSTIPITWSAPMDMTVACLSPLACCHGQTPVKPEMPLSTRAAGRARFDFPGWTPPGTDCSAIVDRLNAVGPGSKCCVWLGERRGGSGSDTSGQRSFIPHPHPLIARDRHADRLI